MVRAVEYVVVVAAVGCGARTGLDERFDPEGPHWSDPTSCGPEARECASGRCHEGDCVRRVFITSTEMSGDLGGLEGADAVCLEHAGAAGFGGRWLAWLSGPTGSPSTRFTRSRAPYVLPDGHEVAEDWDDLTDGSLLTPICVDERAEVSGRFTAWTNTNHDGTWNDGRPDCEGWTTLDSGAGWGQCALPESWSSGEYGGSMCDQAHRIYCFEQ